MFVDIIIGCFAGCVFYLWNKWRLQKKINVSAKDVSSLWNDIGHLVTSCIIFWTASFILHSVSVLVYFSGSGTTREWTQLWVVIDYSLQHNQQEKSYYFIGIEFSTDKGVVYNLWCITHLCDAQNKKDSYFFFFLIIFISLWTLGLGVGMVHVCWQYSGSRGASCWSQ